MQLKKSTLAAAIAVSAAGLAAADVITIDASRDNTLYEDSAGALSNGAGDFIFAGTTAGDAIRRAVLFFDIAGAIAPGGTINSVTLEMDLSRTNSGDHVVNLHRLTQGWGEGTSDATGNEGQGAASTAGDATWVHTFFSGSTWSTAGGDFNLAASGSATVGSTLGTYTFTGGGMATDVQSWLDNSGMNFGWLVIGEETVTGTAKRFNSRENSAGGPRLIIDFTPVPAPGVLAVLCGAAMLRSRRRA